MLIQEYKLDGSKKQYQAIDEAIRVVQFIRNKCLRKWMDGHGLSTSVLKTLSVRTHICHGCGVVLDRDQNAALNILQKALDGTLGHRETSGLDSGNAWGELTATVVPALAQEQVSSPNQEPPAL